MRKVNSATCNDISFLFASYKKCIELAVLAFKTISVLFWAFDVACLFVQLMNSAQRFTKEPTYRKTAKTLTLNSNIRVDHWPKMCRMGQDWCSFLTQVFIFLMLNKSIQYLLKTIILLTIIFVSLIQFTSLSVFNCVIRVVKCSVVCNRSYLTKENTFMSEKSLLAIGGSYIIPSIFLFII